MGGIEITRKRPPSYYRYKKNHPPISITLTTELKDLLDTIKGKGSYGVTAKEILKKELIPALEIKEKLEVEHATECEACRERSQEQIDSIVNTTIRFVLPCSGCKGQRVISDKQADWKTEIYPVLLNAFKDWTCAKCVQAEKLRQQQNIQQILKQRQSGTTPGVQPNNYKRRLPR